MWEYLLYIYTYVNLSTNFMPKIPGPNSVPAYVFRDIHTIILHIICVLIINMYISHQPFPQRIYIYFFENCSWEKERRNIKQFMLCVFNKMHQNAINVLIRAICQQNWKKKKIIPRNHALILREKKEENSF